MAFSGVSAMLTVLVVVVLLFVSEVVVCAQPARRSVPPMSPKRIFFIFVAKIKGYFYIAIMTEPYEFSIQVFRLAKFFVVAGRSAVAIAAKTPVTAAVAAVGSAMSTSAPAAIAVSTAQPPCRSITISGRASG